MCCYGLRLSSWSRSENSSSWALGFHPSLPWKRHMKLGQELKTQPNVFWASMVNIDPELFIFLLKDHFWLEFCVVCWWLGLEIGNKGKSRSKSPGQISWRVWVRSCKFVKATNCREFSHIQMLTNVQEIGKIWNRESAQKPVKGTTSVLGWFPLGNVEIFKNGNSVYSVKDIHCQGVLTFLQSPIVWPTFCQNWSWSLYFFME